MQATGIAPFDSAPQLAELRAHLESKSEASDEQGRRQIAVLAFARRVSARPPLAVLNQDALVLLSELLQADLVGSSEVTARNTLLNQVFQPDPQCRLAERGHRETSLDPEKSMAGQALTVARPIACSPLSAERRFKDPLLREHGVVSALALPLPVGEKPCGTISVYRVEPHDFDQGEMNFAETIAHWLAAAVRLTQAEQLLRRQQSLSQAVLKAADCIVLVLDVEGNLLSMNPSACQLTGFSQEEIRGRSMLSTLAVPAEAETLRRTLAQVAEKRVSAALDGHVLTKASRRQRIHWTVEPAVAEGGTIQAIVLCGREPTAPDRATGPVSRQEPVQQPMNDPGQTLRSSPRRSFRYRQPIAPIYEGRLPSKDALMEVVCNDLSAGGVSFYLPSKPDFEDLVVALGRPPQLSYFSAKVVRVLAEADPEKSGATTFLVGCRFTGRVELQ